MTQSQLPRDRSSYAAQDASESLLEHLLLISIFNNKPVIVQKMSSLVLTAILENYKA